MKLKKWNEYDNAPAKTRYVKNLVESSEKRIQLVLESKIRKAKKEMAKTLEDLEKRLRRMVKEEHVDWNRASVERAGKNGTLYLCDGNNECSGHGECYKIGGCCRHTYDINHSKNFYQFMGKGPLLEDDPEQSSDAKEIRGRIVLKGVKEFKKELNNVKELKEQLKAAVSRALVKKRQSRSSKKSTLRRIQR